VVFWDPTVPPDSFQTTVYNDPGSGNRGTLSAGILLNTITPGHYTVIQVRGLVYAQFMPTLTSPGSVGCPVFAYWGAATRGLANVVFASTDVQSEASLIGKAYDAPSGNSTSRIWLTNTILN
jgi:hypothetical protein